VKEVEEVGEVTGKNNRKPQGLKGEIAAAHSASQ
jgi:hypothetical protein